MVSLAIAYTIGHSTRSFDELLATLQALGVRTLADVRTIPRSRRHPQFNAESLADSLPAAGIQYLQMKALGGLRKPRADSINTSWRNDSFRGYADYMQTSQFAAALAELESIARESSTAIMCAEAVPWRCHRSLIADALVVHGWTVLHIMSATKARPHELNAAARVMNDRVTYPAPGLFAATE